MMNWNELEMQARARGHFEAAQCFQEMQRAWDGSSWERVYAGLLRLEGFGYGFHMTRDIRPEFVGYTWPYKTYGRQFGDPGTGSPDPQLLCLVAGLWAASKV